MNQPPVAKAGQDQTVEVGVQVALDGSNSTDPDSNALSYSWEFSTTPPASGMSTSKITGATSVIAYFTPDVAGTYIVQLTVNDGYATATDSIKITASESVTNPPSAPTITAVEADSQVTVSWDAVSGADSYNLYYRQASTVSKTNGTKVPGVTSPAVVSGLTNGKVYAFIVIAANSAGDSAPSNTATATPTQASSPPAKPTISQATAGDGQVTLTWNAITGATTYNIYHKVGNTVSKTSYDTKRTNVTSPDIVGQLTNGTQYAFILTAENAADESVASNVVTATPQAPPAPPVPTNLHYTSVTESTITLAWNAATGAAGYRMYRSLSSAGTYSQVGSDLFAPTTSFTDTGLAASTAYYYKVSAFNATGQESAKSTPAVQVTTSAAALQIPAVPTGLRVTGVTDTSVDLAWDFTANASGYRMYRSATSGGTYNQVGTDIFGSTTFTDNGVAPSTTYYYKVLAFNGAGPSALSASVPATTPAPPLQAPQTPGNLHVTAVTESSVSLAWSGVALASEYRAYRSPTSGGTYTKVGTIDSTNTGFIDTGVEPSTTYYYEVSAFNSAGESARSTPPVQATTSAAALQIPAVPTGLRVTGVTDTSVDLAWDFTANASGYRMYRSATSGGTYNQVGTDIFGSTTFTDNTVAPSTTYYYKVLAFNAAGPSAKSASVPATTPAPPLQAPQTPGNLHVTAVTESSVSLAWSGVALASEYRVYRSLTSGGTYTKVGTIDSADTAFIDTGVAPSTTYYYKVSAFNSAGESALSTPPVQATTPAAALQIPAVPTGLRVTGVTDTSVDLAWDFTANASGYRMYRSATSGGTYNQVGTDIFGSTSSTDNTVAPSTIYYYKVLAFNAAGQSALSAAVQVTTAAPPLQPPATPANLHSTTVTDSSVNMTWNAVANADGYRLYRSGSSGGPFLQTGPDLAGISYSDTSVTASTTYYYKVSAFNSAGESSRSTAWQVTTAAPPLQTPATPTGFHFGTVTDNSVNLLWDPMANASGYRVYRSNTSGGQYGQVGTDIAGATSYQDSNLSPQTTYYYKVSAFNSAGESAMSTPPVQVTTAAPPLQPPLAPGNLHTTSVTDTQVNLAWNSYVTASGYRLYRSGSPGGPFTQIGADMAVTNYQDGSVSASTTYYYAVSAFNSAGSSALSTPAVSVTTPAPPQLPPTAAPANLRQTASTLSSVSLAWDTVTGAAWYQLYRDGTLIFSDSALAYTDQGLASSATYQYKVQAWNNAGGGPQSANVPGTTQSPVSNHAPIVSGSPNPPNGATNVVLDVTVSWVFSDQDGDNLSYRFYYRPESQGSFNGPFYTGSTPSWVLNGLALGVKYFWYAEADDGRGGIGSTPINSFTARGNSAPQVYNPNPPNFATGVGVNLTLGWGGNDPDFDAVNYKVYLATNFAQIDLPANKIFDGANNGWTILFTLAYSTTYYWKVVATDSFSATSFGQWQFTTQPAPGNPTLSFDLPSVTMATSDLQPAPGYVVVNATAKEADLSNDTLSTVTSDNQNVAHGVINGLQIRVYSGTQKGTAVLTVTSGSGVTATISVTVNDSIIEIIAH